MTKSEACAIHDGIKIILKERGWRGSTSVIKIYVVPCHRCGTETERTIYTSEKEYLCEYCKLTLKRKVAAQQEPVGIQTKKELALDKAKDCIRKQVKNFEAYDTAVKLAEKRAESFGSIPEAMVAIELLRLGYKVIPQQKVGKYRVDFALPEIKVVIEVDGGLYHKNIYKNDREAIIQLSLGMKWEIIHIPAELISQDIQKLKKVIDSRIGDTRGKNM